LIQFLVDDVIGKTLKSAQWFLISDKTLRIMAFGIMAFGIKIFSIRKLSTKIFSMTID
jgi:hypothetical protein